MCPPDAGPRPPAQGRSRQAWGTPSAPAAARQSWVLPYRPAGVSPGPHALDRSGSSTIPASTSSEKTPLCYQGRAGPGGGSSRAGSLLEGASGARGAAAPNSHGGHCRQEGVAGEGGARLVLGSR